MAADYERVLLVKPEVHVFRIPPRTTNRGYRAADWKLDSPDWVSRMKVMAHGKKCYILIEDKNTGDLFAKAPVPTYPGEVVEAVLDSSRYFVIRVEDEAGKRAFIGIGFQDRTDSFDFNVALQEHFKHLKQEEDFAQEAKKLDSGPKLDLGFKEGQTITINIGNKEGSASKPRTRPTGGSATGGMPPLLLPPPGGKPSAPPPSSGQQPAAAAAAQQTNDIFGPPLTNPNPSTSVISPPQNQTQQNNSTADWGDFTSASSSSSSSNNSSSSSDWVQF